MTPAPTPARPTPTPRSDVREVAIGFEDTTGVKIAGVLLRPRKGESSLRAPSTPLPVADGRLLLAPVLQVQGVPTDAAEAAIALLDRDGRVIARTPLPVPVPDAFAYTPPPELRLLPGKVGVAIEVMMASADGHLEGWRSAPVTLTLLDDGAELLPEGAPDKVVRADLFADDGALNESLLDWLGRQVAKFQGDDLLVVSLHSGGSAALGRTRAAAPRVREALLRAGLSADRLLVLSLGASTPDADPEGWRLGRDRVEIRRRVKRAGAETSAKGFSVAQGLWIDGVAVVGNDANEPPSRVRVRTGAPTLVELQMEDGTGALWKRVFPAPPGAAGTAVTPTPAAEDRQSPSYRLGEQVLDALRKELDAGKAATAPAKLGDKPAGQPDAAAVAGAASDQANADKTAAAAGTEGTAGANAGAAPAREVPLSEAGDIGAAALQLRLPADGAILGAERLAVTGRSRPGNTVRVNGVEVPLGADGRFSRLVDLAPGPQQLTVQVRDAAGNEASVVRNYVVRDRAYFLMAVAEGAVGQIGAKVQGMSDRTSLEAGGVLLHGRGAVYLKGRIKGDVLGFQSVRYTAHLDTARNGNLQQFQANLFDPDRYYPVYGDNSVDVQDAQARGPLYVLVEADRSKATFGNFRTGVDGWELLRYDRTMYGGQLDLQRVFAGDLDTRAKLFAAQEDRTLARRTDMLRGTGGSLFYLSGRDVLEGSERVWIVVRDRDNGIELGRFAMNRNVDYIPDYREGRLLFKSPVNSAVDAFFAIGQNGMAGQHLHWNGHPVFVLTTYEARAIDGVGGANVGAVVEERVFGGKLRIGAGYVHEARDGEGSAAYQLAGGHVEARLGNASRARAEVAWSRSRDSLVSVSDDGGLTFGQQRDAASRATASEVSGLALSLVVDADLGDLAKAVGVELGKSDLNGAGAGFEAQDPARKAPDSQAAATASSAGHLRAHYRWVQQGFHSNGVLTEQGQQKVGFDARFALHRDNALSLRYDGILTGARPDAFAGLGLGNQGGLQSQWGAGATATSGSFTPLGRHLVTLQDLHRLSPRWNLLSSLAYSGADATDGSLRHSVTLAEGAAYRFSDRLTLRGEQQLILGGDANQLQTRALDQLQSVVGLEWRIFDSLSLTVAERLGWGGQNATMAGLRTAIGKDTSLYVQQRLEDSYQTGRPVSATVIGAEQRYSEGGRAFGEYQVDALNAGRMNRAILGLGKRFALAPGLHVDASYERAQTFSGPTGATSRDAFSLGGEWLRAKHWKLSSRQEARVDQGDEALGGVRKLQLVSLNAVEVQASRALSLFGRGNLMRTTDQSKEKVEAETLQGTVGWAYRSPDNDWFQLIGRYTHLREQRPAAIDLGLSERSRKHIFAIEPIIETPWGFQWAHKLAFRRADEVLADGPALQSDTWLGISRLGYHLSSRLDAAVEYRLLVTTASRALEHGALVEAAWIFAKTLRLGAGWNFTRFQENLQGDFVRDEGGFFLRVLGMY